MKKFWLVYCVKNAGAFPVFDTYNAAEAQAKRLAYENRSNEYVVMEAISVAQQPVPPIEMVKL